MKMLQVLLITVNKVNYYDSNIYEEENNYEKPNYDDHKINNKKYFTDDNSSDEYPNDQKVLLKQNKLKFSNVIFNKIKKCLNT